MLPATPQLALSPAPPLREELAARCRRLLPKAGRSFAEVARGACVGELPNGSDGHLVVVVEEDPRARDAVAVWLLHPGAPERCHAAAGSSLEAALRAAAARAAAGERVETPPHVRQYVGFHRRRR